jgi:hypothetical protein
MKANAATIHVRHVERSASQAVPRGVGMRSEAKNPISLLILGWIVGWGVLLVLAVVALAAVSTSVAPRAAAVPAVRRPSDSGMVPAPSMLFDAEHHVDDVP